MNPPNQIRAAIAKQLQASLKHNDLTYSQLAERAHIPEVAVHNAIQFGIVEVTDLVFLTRHLGLCAVSILGEATNHQEHETVGAPLADARDRSEWHDITDPDHPIPTNRWLEIKCATISAKLYAIYLADGDRFQIGHDSVIERKDVTLWRAQPLPH